MAIRELPTHLVTFWRRCGWNEGRSVGIRDIAEAVERLGGSPSDVGLALLDEVAGLRFPASFRGVLFDLREMLYVFGEGYAQDFGTLAGLSVFPLGIDPDDLSTYFLDKDGRFLVVPEDWIGYHAIDSFESFCYWLIGDRRGKATIYDLPSG